MPWAVAVPPGARLLRDLSDGQAGIGAATEVEDAAEEEEREEKNVRCSHCGHEVTVLSEQTSVSGGHRHSFANPHGLLFEVGCFKSAPGCRAAGPPSEEFTWFSGYAWRIAVCGNCLSHLGWFFVQAGETGFIALILDRVVFPGE